MEGLKPIYYRLEELGNKFPVDPDVQAQVAAVKQHLMTRGRWLKEQQPGGTSSNPTFTPPPPPPLMGGAPAMGNAPHPPPMGGAPYTPPPPPPPLMSSQQMPATSQMPQQQMPLEASRQVFIPPLSTPPPGPAYQEPPPAGSVSWKKPVLIGLFIGLLLVGGVIGTLAYLNKKKNAGNTGNKGTGVTTPLAGAVKVDVATIPPGADIQVNNQSKCKSNCVVDLTAGQYTLLAILPGYEQAIQNVTVEKGHPLSFSLTLVPQSASVKILTDLGNNGKVLLDGNVAGTMQEGQVVLDKVAAGPHEITIAGDRGSEAKFSIQVAPGAAPAINGPIAAKNLVAVLASGLGNQIHIATSVTPMKVSLDGKPVGDAGAAGIDLNDVAPGDHEITLNDGKDDRKLTITAGPTPTLTAWVNANTSGGTLVVNAGEDGATVTIDGKPYPRKTKRGQLWIPNMAPKDYKIKVAKEGFQDVPEQMAAVKKGAETRLAFKLQAFPQIAVLHINGGTPGAHVLIDNRSVGQIDADGTLSYANITPGDHTVEIKRDQYMPKSMTQTFRAGATLELSGDSVILERATGTLRVSVTPNSAQITIRRSDEARANPIFAGPHTLSAGSYTLVAKAPGYSDATATVTVKPGEVVPADLRLTKEGGSTTITKPPTTRADWEHPGEWKSNNGWMVHTGGNFVPFSAQPSTGTFSFSVQLLKGGVFNKNIKWRAAYMDEKNYVQYQLDKKGLESKVVTNGKSANRPKAESDGQEPYTLQIEITPDSVITRMRKGEQWITLDTLMRTGAGSGKFGFFIPGSEEVAVASFTFNPR